MCRENINMNSKVIRSWNHKPLHISMALSSNWLKINTTVNQIWYHKPFKKWPTKECLPNHNNEKQRTIITFNYRQKQNWRRRVNDYHLLHWMQIKMLNGLRNVLNNFDRSCSKRSIQNKKAVFQKKWNNSMLM